jgi:hypothetical protein
VTRSESKRIFAEGAEVDDLRAFVLKRWRDRAVEQGLPLPDDLSSSCKFGALFVREILGGEIRGNWAHVHCRLADGRILDPSRNAEDVETIRARRIDPYEHDRTFIRSRDFRDSLDTCRPRVKAWAEEWRTTRPDITRKAP